MQDQIKTAKEVISIFLKGRKEGEKELVEWFLNNVMEEDAKLQVYLTKEVFLKPSFTFDIFLDS